MCAGENAERALACCGLKVIASIVQGLDNRGKVGKFGIIIVVGCGLPWLFVGQAQCGSQHRSYFH